MIGVEKMSYSEWVKGRETGYIDRAKLLNEMEHECENCEFRDSDGYECEECDYAHVMLYVKAQKAIKIQPVKHGKWEYYKNNGIFDTHKCTLCGEKYEIYMGIEPTTIYKYCPNCGAKMIKDGEQNED